MKTLVTALLASTFIVGPAFACNFGKTAGYKKSDMTASVDQSTNEEAMSTFDPAKKPAFDDKKSEAVKEPVKKEAESITE